MPFALVTTSPNMDTTYCPSEVSGTTICDPAHDVLLSRLEEAEQVLRTSTSDVEIYLVCSLFPFPDPRIRSTILSDRYSARLDAILNALRAGDHDCDNKAKSQILSGRLSSRLHDSQTNRDDRSKSEKAEDILSRIDLDVPIPASWEDQWSLPMEPTILAGSIIYSIERKVLVEVSKVDFRDFIRGAFGYITPAMRRLATGAGNTQRELRRRFHELQQPKKEYELAAKEMNNPLAKQLVSTSLSDNLFPDLYDAFDALFVPIRNLFAEQDLPLLPMLRRLGILKALYKTKILKGEEDDKWESLSAADFSFVDLITSHSPQDLTNKLTLSDQGCFQKLCGEDFYSIRQDGTSSRKRLARMRSSCLRLAHAVDICATAHPDLVEHISETTKHLLDLRNFHSGMAFLQGIRDAEYRPAKLSEYWELLDPTNMYAVYRAYVAKGPSLVYVFPHGNEIRRAAEANKSRIICELFRSILEHFASPRCVGDVIVFAEPGNSLEPAASEWSPMPDMLWVMIGMVAQLVQMATRKWARYRSSASRFSEMPHGEDVEKGIQDASRSASLDIEKICFDSTSNPSRDLGIIHGREFLARLNSERIEREQKRPRIIREVRKRRRFLCSNCKIRTGRKCKKCSL